MTHRQDPAPAKPKLGKFAWEQVSSTANRLAPELQRHNDLFNELALKRKYRTTSGKIKFLNYRQPSLGRFIAGIPAAAAPPTGKGWVWLDGDGVRSFEDLGLTETANSLKPRSD